MYNDLRDVLFLNVPKEKSLQTYKIIDLFSNFNPTFFIFFNQIPFSCHKMMVLKCKLIREICFLTKSPKN